MAAADPYMIVTGIEPSLFSPYYSFHVKWLWLFAILQAKQKMLTRSGETLRKTDNNNENEVQMFTLRVLQIMKPTHCCVFNSY